MTASEELVGYPEVARWLGVSIDAVRKMRSRHANFPEPVKWKGDSPRWEPSQKESILVWRARLPGRGYWRQSS